MTWTLLPRFASSQASDRPITPPPMIKTSCIVFKLSHLPLAEQGVQALEQPSEVRIGSLLEAQAQQQGIQALFIIDVVPARKLVPGNVCRLQPLDRLRPHSGGAPID